MHACDDVRCLGQPRVCRFACAGGEITMEFSTVSSATSHLVCFKLSHAPSIHCMAQVHHYLDFF